MALTSNDIGKRYNFETHLRFRFNNQVFLSILDAQTLLDLGQDVQAWHQQNIGVLPPGAPTSFRGYTYGKFQDSAGKISYVGLPWINPTTLVEISSVVTTITIPESTPEQIDSLRAMMQSIGIRNFTVSNV